MAEVIKAFNECSDNAQFGIVVIAIVFMIGLYNIVVALKKK